MIIDNYEKFLVKVKSAASNSVPAIYSGQSQLWTKILERRLGEPEAINSFLSFDSDAGHGVGASGLSEADYKNRHKEFMSRYGEEVNPEYLAAFAEPEAGNPTQLPFGEGQCSAFYLGTLAFSKKIRKLIKTYHADKPLKMLEIGAGFGGMAELLVRDGTVKSIVDVDLTANLLLASSYLSACHPEKKVSIFDRGNGKLDDDYDLGFVLADDIDQIDERFDVIFNSRSLAEMPKETAQAYIRWVSEHLAPGGIFITINGVRRSPDGVQKYADYPYHLFKILGIYACPGTSNIGHDQYGVLVLSADDGTEIPDGFLDRLDPLFYLGIRDEVEHFLGDLRGKEMGACLTELEQSVRPYAKACRRYFASGKASPELARYLEHGKSPMARAFCYAACGGDASTLPEHLRAQAERLPKAIRMKLSKHLGIGKFERVRHRLI